MDNLTHTLIGTAFVRTLPKRFQRPEIYWASILGNNAPDADVLIHFIPGSSGLDYLIHHRGYTHSFLLAPVLGLLSAFIAKRITGIRDWSPALFIAGFLGCLLHIGADFMNSYGVHPFSPFSDRWYYGDAVYIVEPLIWFSLLPLIIYAAERKWARAGWWTLSLSMVALVWLFPNFNRGLAASLTALFFFGVFLVRSSESAVRRTLITITLVCLTVGGFFTGAASARKLVRGYWQSVTEGKETYLDTASNPVPGNPFCWNLWLASHDAESFYFRSVTVSLAPSIIRAEECDLSSIKTTADLTPSRFLSTSVIRWQGESRLPRSLWSKYRDRNTTFRRFLSFARFPFIKELPNGNAIIGDLRYDRQPGLGFSEFEVSITENTPVVGGPWNEPLLENAKIRE